MSLSAVCSQADAAHAVIVRNNANNTPVFALRALLTQLIQHASLSYPELKQLWNTMKANSVNPSFKTYFSPRFCSFKSPGTPFTNEQELNASFCLPGLLQIKVPIYTPAAPLVLKKKKKKISLDFEKKFLAEWIRSISHNLFCVIVSKAKLHATQQNII